MKQLAIDKGVVPADADKTYFQNELAKKNTVALWVLMSREEKISAINGVKKIFKENNGAVLKLSSTYYVNELNAVLYTSIEQGDVDATNRRGIGNMLKTIALMDGDYDNGKNKVESLRKYIGEELFKVFKERYPEKYKNLLAGVLAKMGWKG